jgi:hydrogenase maturation protease
MPPKWLVLGLGNRLAGADAFGPAVIERLRAARAADDDVELVDAHTDLLAYLHRFPAHDEVVLIDAVLDDRGGVACIDEDTFAGWDGRMSGAHAMSPVAVVKLFWQLHPEAATRFTLVAHFVQEATFGHAPDTGAVNAAVTVVQTLVDGGAGCILRMKCAGDGPRASPAS